jgi:hypothetical protein
LASPRLRLVSRGAVLAPSASALDPVDIAKLRKAVTVNGILRHERVLQSIANANGGIRASGTAGRIQGHRAAVRVPVLPADADPVFERVSPSPRVFTPDEFATMTYSGSADVNAPLQAVDVVVPIGSNPPNTSSSGCEAADFTGLPPATSR